MMTNYTSSFLLLLYSIILLYSSSCCFVVHGFSHHHDASSPVQTNYDRTRRIDKLFSSGYRKGFNEDSSILLNVRGGKEDELPSTTKKGFNAAYIRLIEKYPVRTKSITAGMITALGDLIAQFIECTVAGASIVFDFRRLLGFTIAATIYVGPFVHYIYELLWFFGRRMEAKGIQKTWRTIAQVLFDQTIGVWLFFPSYFYVHAVVEGAILGRAPTKPDVNTKVLYKVIVSNYKVWPLANFLNFTFVPENLRVLVSNIVSILWNAYLCTQMAG